MPRSARRVLVTRLKFLGDVVLTTPVLHALRTALPDASIEYLTLTPFAPALAHHPDVDVVHTLAPRAGLAETVRMAAKLARPRVDWWIDLMGSPRSALLALLSRPRVAVGPARGLRSRVFHHRRESPPGDRSAVLHHMDKLVPLLGQTVPVKVQIVADPLERARVASELGVEPARPPVVVHPGSTWPATAWPAEYFSELLAALHRDGVGPLWVIGTPADPTLAPRVVGRSKVPARALDPLPLPRLLGLLDQAATYVGNDGGVLHCAIALGVPAVAIFGPTEPEVWFPHASPQASVVVQPVPCRPCHLHECSHLTCLRTLMPPVVVRAVHAVRSGSALTAGHA